MQVSWSKLENFLDRKFQICGWIRTASICWSIPFLKAKSFTFGFITSLGKNLEIMWHRPQELEPSFSRSWACCSLLFEQCSWMSECEFPLGDSRSWVYSDWAVAQWTWEIGLAWIESTSCVSVCLQLMLQQKHFRPWGIKDQQVSLTVGGWRAQDRGARKVSVWRGPVPHSRCLLAVSLFTQWRGNEQVHHIPVLVM